jgi:putative SOS response-associated peptidase YedK
MGDIEKELEKLSVQTPAMFYVNGFDHPDVPVITGDQPDHIQLFSWGLIPFWVKDVPSALAISNKTLNARGEEMFNKPSFKVSARKKRCLVMVDGFFEYHWKNNLSFPYFIKLKNEEPMLLAGLWETWFFKPEQITRNTFTIVTTRANRLMEKIHNQPKASEEPRMPVIIKKNMEQVWLTAQVNSAGEWPEFKDLIEPYKEEELEAFPVPKLKGKSGAGNSPVAVQYHKYPELEVT